MYKHTASNLTNMNSDVEFQIARIFGKKFIYFLWLVLENVRALL